MDLAGTFFADLMAILLALQDISVFIHFTKNLDLDELDYFEFISVVCRHRHFFSFVQLFCRLWAEQSSNEHMELVGLWSCIISKFAEHQTMYLLSFLMKIWSILWYFIDNIIIITEANLVFKMICFYVYIFWQHG